MDFLKYSVFVLTCIYITTLVDGTILKCDDFSDTFLTDTGNVSCQNGCWCSSTSTTALTYENCEKCCCKYVGKKEIVSSEKVTNHSCELPLWVYFVVALFLAVIISGSIVLLVLWKKGILKFIGGRSSSKFYQDTRMEMSEQTTV